MIYNINKGSNYATLPIPIPTTKTGFGFRFKIEGTFPYNIGEDQTDINKLFGLAESWDIHANTVMVGWRNLGKSEIIELFIYVHNRHSNPRMGARNIWFEKIGECLPNQWADCQMGIDKKRKQYYVVYQGKRFGIARTKSRTGWWRYFVPSYWGGDTKAPHDYRVSVDLL